MVRPQLELQESSPLANANYNAGIETIGDGVEGKRVYELSNHLGNVLATISDRKIGVDDGGGPEIDYYIAEVLSQNDYYPFGMLMPGRKYSASGVYRYGFNGQEKSTEISSEGNLYAAQFWEYDSRLGRRWNLDPKPTVGISQYSAFANNPIFNSDPLGDTTVPQGDWYRRQVGKNVTYKYAAGSDKKQLDANSKTWWKIPEASRDREVTFENSFAPTAVGTSFRLHEDGTFTVRKSDYRVVDGHIKWKINIPDEGGGGNVYIQARDYMQSKAVGDGSFWGAGGTLAGDKVIKVGGTVITKLAAKTGTKLFGKEVVTTTTRMGRDGKAVEVIFKDGTKIDINAARVKQWTPNTHPNAPSGTLQKVKFENSLPGSKGYKRTPTQSELDFLNGL